MLLQAFGRVNKNHAVFFEFLLNTRVGSFRIILGFYTGKKGPLLLRHTKTFERL